MTLQEILDLRPKGTDRASIVAALEAAKAARVSTLEKAEALERQAAAGLLTATDEELLDLEQQAQSARLAADRIDKLLAEIGALLPPAERAELVATANADLASATKLSEDFCAAWKAKYLKAAMEIVALLELEKQASRAWEDMHRRLHQIQATRSDWASGEFPGVGIAPHREMFAGFFYGDGGSAYPPHFVQLPGVDPAKKTLWTLAGPDARLISLKPGQFKYTYS